MRRPHAAKVMSLNKVQVVHCVDSRSRPLNPVPSVQSEVYTIVRFCMGLRLPMRSEIHPHYPVSSVQNEVYHFQSSLYVESREST